MEEAGRLAESTAVLLNVSEFDDATKASEALISTMQAFQYTANESQHVVDVLNEVGNNYAVSSDGIATALQDSASALMEGGNNLEQAVALVAAANRVVQDPNSVGSALRTISLRLRGTSVKVLEEMGEETEGVIESTSKLQEKIKALSGVDILTDTGDYKDTYTILKEIGNVWADMSDIDQAALLELMAGKNRANTLSAILSNMTDLEGAYKSALNAEGSAMRENEAYLDSIQGRIDLFNNSVQTMWMNFIDSDVVKFIVDLGTRLVKLIDYLGVLQTLLTVVGGLWVNKRFGDKLFADPEVIKTTTENLKDLGDSADEFGEKLSFDLDDATESAEDMGDAVKNVDADVIDLGNDAQQMGDQANEGFKKGEKGATNMGNSIKNAIKSMLVMYAISKALELLRTIWTSIGEQMTSSAKDFDSLQENYQEWNDKLSECESELRSLEAELDTTNDKIEELEDQGTLSFVEQEELDRLRDVSAELERQISMKQTLQSSLQQGTNAAAIQAGEAYLNTSFTSDKSKSERQEEWAEAWGDAGATIGLAACAIIAGFATGGVTWSTLPIILAAGGAGSMAGEAIFSHTGSVVAGGQYDSEQTVGEAIAAMNETRDELVKARDETYAAYAANPMDDDAVSAYEQASKELSMYDEDMANSMQQMSQYYNTIMSNWENASDEQRKVAVEYGDMIDKYNIEMGGINAKSNAINRIFGVEMEVNEDLKKVKAALEEMAKEGEEINLEKAFDDTDAYEAFVDRMYDLGIYVYELEDAFIELKKAEDLAAEVDFHDIANDIVGITDALSGVKTALDEFYEKGHTSANTILELGEHFDTDTLKEAYSEYAEIMLSGTVSSADAKAATEQLAQTYIDEKIALGELTADQRLIYEVHLTDLGIANASEFIEDALQRAGMQELEGVYEEAMNDAIEKYNPNDGLLSGPMYDFSNGHIKRIDPLEQAKTPWENLTEDERDKLTRDELNPDDLNAITEKYGIEATAIDGVNTKLQERLVLEEKLAEAQSDQDYYENWYKRYNEAKQDWETIAKKWGFVGEMKFSKKTDMLGHTTYMAHSTDGAKHVVGKEYYEQMREAYEEYDTMLDRGASKSNGFLTFDEDEKGNRSNYKLVDGFRKQFQEAVDGAKKKLDEFDEEADTEIEVVLELETEPVLDTISDLTTAFGQLQESMKAVNEISYDGQQISEDLYNTLSEQLAGITVGEEEFKHAIDDSNGYVVKNVALLKKLIAQSKKAKKATVEVAKAQTLLEYRELADEIRKKTRLMADEWILTGHVSDATLANVAAMHEQLEILRETIQEYALLEVSLSNAAQAYSDYEAAKERDAKITYDESFEEMLKTIDNGILQNRTGTEEFEYAVRAIVPEDVWAGIEDPDEKIKAIHDYIDGNETFSKLFSVDEESGDLSITTDNVREFISMCEEAGLVKGGPNGFSLAKGVDGVKDFADALGITEAAVLALLSRTEDVDALWGDILTDVTLEPVNRDVKYATDYLADATKAMEDFWEEAERTGKFDATEYKKLQDNIATAEDAYNEATVAAQENAKKYTIVQAAILSYRGELELTDEQARILASNLKDIDGLAELGEITIQNGQLLFINEQMDLLLGKRAELDKPSVMDVQLQYDEISSRISEIKKQLLGKWETPLTFAPLSPDEKAKLETELSTLLTQQQAIEVEYGITETSSEEDKSVLESYQELAENGLEFAVTADVTNALSGLGDILSRYEQLTDKEITITTVEKKKTIWEQIVDYAGFLGIGGKKSEEKVSEALGNARATGNVGLKNAEYDAVVGELGPELVVDAARGVYYTVGENGTEMVNLPKGAIIYNHKQTAELLKNGHTTRGHYTGGLSFAQGNAHAQYGVPSYHPNTEDKTSFANGATINNKWDDAVSSLSDALSDASDSVNEFEETIDWIEIRMEELDEALSLYSAKLENETSYSAKNNIIDEMIKTNHDLRTNAIAGAKYYEEHAEKYLTGMSDELITAAKNGAISITEFTKENDEATVKAIQNYRDYAQKAADLYQQAEETIATIRDLAIQRVDIAYEAGNVRATVEDSQTEKLQNAVGYDEERGLITSDAYYIAMMENSNKKIEYLTSARKAMQEELNAAVKNGEVIRGSNEWYELLDKMYQVDAQIDEATIELEEFQNAINDLYWENFDQLISRLDYLKDETQSLIDLMDSADMVTKPEGRTYENGTVKFWTADDVEWTDEGLASLGLYAQQMEIAEYQAKQYAEAIDDLTKDYKKGLYSENEYLEKLNELKSAQYENIESYEDAKQAIVDLNETRIDSIKDGISKEIEAFEELIEAKKNALDAEKD